jgi:hypothetical protein
MARILDESHIIPADSIENIHGFPTVHADLRHGTVRNVRHALRIVHICRHCASQSIIR